MINQLNVIMYGLVIHNGLMDVVHNNGRRIIEYYIPSYGISFNYVDDRVNIFETPDGRYELDGATHLGDFSIHHSIVKTLLEYIKIKKLATKKIARIAEDYN